MSELLPCPFCGSESEHKFLNELGVEAARCNKCQITISLSKWNTRFITGKRPQIVNLQLEDLADAIQAYSPNGNSHTENYIAKLENANSAYIGCIEADRERMKAMHKANNQMRSLLYDALERFSQYEMDEDAEYHRRFVNRIEEALGIKQ